MKIFCSFLFLAVILTHNLNTSGHEVLIDDDDQEIED